MKHLRIILITLILIGSISEAYSQHYLGIRAGYGAGSARFFPAKETGYVWGLPSGGLSYKFYSDVKYVGAIEIDLQYTGKGFKYDLAKNSDTSYMRKLSSIELPLFWQPHVYFFNYHAKFFLNLGVNISYNFHSSYEYSTKSSGVYEEGKYPFMITRDNRFGYGLCAGAGFSVLFNRWEILAEGRYYFGYSDILKNTSKYELNPRRSPLDNINISLGVYYRLGKGDIRSKKIKPKI